MTAIPPNWLGSIIQGQGAQQRANEAKAAENAGQARRTSGDAFADRLSDVIETGDRDSSVYEDAEGAGGQGKSSGEDAEESVDEQDDAADDQAGDDLDGDGALGGLDLQA